MHQVYLRYEHFTVYTLYAFPSKKKKMKKELQMSTELYLIDFSQWY